MAAATERELGPPAIDFVRKRLQTGKTFAKELLRFLPLDTGRVVTYLPGDVPDDAAHQFNYAGKFQVDASQTRYYADAEGRRVRVERVPDDAAPWARSHIRSHLQQANAIGIVEDFIKEPSDRFWQTNPPRYCVPTFVGNEVYYVVFPADSDKLLEDAMRHAGGAWPGVLAALTSVNAHDQLREDRLIDPAQWPGLAERTTALVVGAYDGEGYLVWSHKTD